MARSVMFVSPKQVSIPLVEFGCETLWDPSPKGGLSLSPEDAPMVDYCKRVGKGRGDCAWVYDCDAIKEGRSYS